ncbi:MAG TPA: 50S ribosomal protein L11 methyltransferase, partial [Thermomicrobiales bacterium]|nr:50S ribosomal protein L11 methyltransferase [Thermomicrobiales bacterium]
VVANIIARILIELAPGLINAVRPGGTLILGGIIDVKEEAVRDAFDRLGLTLVRREEREDWVALVLRKPAQ